MPVYIVMLGAPGAGKGTQASIISEKYQLTHVSSGDIFRENIKNETELGKQVSEILKRGELVPDDVTIAMIKERLARDDCKHGAVLDGFPRTPAQAEALDKMLGDFEGKVDIVPYIKVDESVLISRLTGRWTCRANSHIFHETFSPPSQPGICDMDGSELYQRDDDKAETVTNRIHIYFEQTAPLIAHYKESGVLTEINGGQQIAKVTAELLGILPDMN
ncbi:MAG: adenylate kinase [Chloroflexota bacterium]